MLLYGQTTRGGTVRGRRMAVQRVIGIRRGAGDQSLFSMDVSDIRKNIHFPWGTESSGTQSLARMSVTCVGANSGNVNCE